MNHVTRVKKSDHPYEWVTSHMWYCHTCGSSSAWSVRNKGFRTHNQAGAHTRKWQGVTKGYEGPSFTRLFDPAFWMHHFFTERKRCTSEGAMILRNEKGGGLERLGPKTWYELLAIKMLPHAQNSSHLRFSCRFQEPIRRSYTYGSLVQTCLGENLRHF